MPGAEPSTGDAGTRHNKQSSFLHEMYSPQKEMLENERKMLSQYTVKLSTLRGGNAGPSLGLGGLNEEDAIKLQRSCNGLTPQLTFQHYTQTVSE